MSAWLDDALHRSAPAAPPAGGAWLAVAAAVAVACVAVPGIWLRLRVLVTVVHELGHAAVGVLAGRRFTGFVVRADMSGHAVTRGRPSGPGLAATLFAGYPAPAVAGAALVVAALRGSSAPTLVVLAAAAAVSLLFSRSWRTAGVMLALASSCSALWWWAPQQWRAGALVAAGLFLLLGAWRHLGTVARAGGRGDDPAALARVTGAPAWLWLGFMLLVAAAATGAVGWAGWGLWETPVS